MFPKENDDMSLKLAVLEEKHVHIWFSKYNIGGRQLMLGMTF